MNPQLLGILLCALLGAALGHRMRCYDCGGGPSNSCKQTVITCGEGERCGFLDRKPQPSSEQVKQSSVTLSHHYPACVATHHCNQVAIESVGDVTFTTQKNCCFGDLCNGAVASSVTPLCILAAVVTTLAWLLPGL
ncbi:lymphocyte antigen 6 complex locus protein G6d isoform X3 [Grammomys surdaster]|uniref:lymphocyte antigen 6 complex locus protein G6d isoform X3 n=2 Tax=Grammomys surdaster TaxID=491861 RepID=UPI00109F4CA7|nr:lymphocyte antigen 6 complex locus protein G6d isoform X3 [Grammomys surdaster]